MKVKGGQEARYHIDHVRARTGGEKGINNDDSDIEDDDDDLLPPVLDTPPVPALPPGDVDQEHMVPMDAVEPPHLHQCSDVQHALIVPQVDSKGGEV